MTDLSKDNLNKENVSGEESFDSGIQYGSAPAETPQYQTVPMPGQPQYQPEQPQYQTVQPPYQTAQPPYQTTQPQYQAAPMYGQPQYQTAPMPGQVPEKSDTIGLGEWVGIILLMMIPCAGVIMLFVWAFSDPNATKRNFAKAYLIIMGVATAIIIAFYVMIFTMVINYF